MQKHMMITVSIEEAKEIIAKHLVGDPEDVPDLPTVEVTILGYSKVSDAVSAVAHVEVARALAIRKESGEAFQKIHCIKQVRKQTDCLLKEAKDAVEEWMGRLM